MINIENIFFTYQSGMKTKIQALSGIDAVVENGEFVAILGHNGCGKSTLSRHLNALLIPSEGKVTVDGLDTKDFPKTWEIRKKCGMVFQNPDNQIVATVVEEEVAFGPENIGVERGEILRRIEDSLESVGLKGFEKSSSNLLSGGQKQRLAIAGIIAMKPDYIILDEATSMLDPHGRDEVLRTVKTLNKEYNITVVYITHSMQEALFADRIIVMSHGKIAMVGTPVEIFSRVDEMKSLHLDVPPMAELACILRKNGLNLPGNILTLEDMVSALSSFLREDCSPKNNGKGK